MKCFFRVASILALVVCLCFPVGASAVDAEPDVSDDTVDASSAETASNASGDTSTESITTETDSGNVTINVTVPAAETDENVVEDVSPSDIEPEPAPVTVLYTARTLDDMPVSSTPASYTLTPNNFDASYIDWSVSDDVFTLLITDAWYEDFGGGYDKETVLAMLAEFPFSVTYNGEPFSDYTVDFDIGSITFSYLGDGSYIVASDAGIYMDFSIIRTAGSSTGSSSLGSAVTALFGSYTPRTQTVTEYLSDGTTVSYTEVVPGLAGLDWPWITSVALFAMALYCIFRMIGGLMKWT